MSGGMPELGSKISLISKADIRYEGRLFTVDPTECTIALANVRSFGTEDRETQYPIAPQSQIYDYILFRGTDIKDIRVVNNGMPHPNDPAIMQMQLPNGQHLMPPFPMPTMNPPMGGYGNPFGTMSNLGGLGSAAGLAPGSFMLGGTGNVGGSGNNSGGVQKSKQQSELNDAIPDPSTVTSTTISAPNVPTAAVEHKDQDLLTCASRSTTPVSLVSRKSPSADMAAQVNQNMGGGSGMNNRDTGGHNKRQNHQQQRNSVGGIVNQQQRGGGNDGNRIRRDSGKMHQAQQQDNRNHQRNMQNNRGWVNRNNNVRGNRGRGRIQNQGGYRQPGNPNKGGRPAKNTIKFEQDYDFEQANSKFEELRSQLSKLKVGDDTKNDQINGEVDKKDDSGNETGAGEHEQEEEEIVVGYDKTKSFFDNISCEAAADRSKGKSRNDWRQERKLNSETFGISSTRRNNYRGRGGYYNRNMNSHGGYNRGYRGGNYRGRTNNSTNIRNGQPNTGLPNKNAATQQNQNQQQGQQQNQQSQGQQQQSVNSNVSVATATGK